MGVASLDIGKNEDINLTCACTFVHHFTEIFLILPEKNWKPDHGFVAKMQIFGDAFTAGV